MNEVFYILEGAKRCIQGKEEKFRVECLSRNIEGEKEEERRKRWEEERERENEKKKMRGRERGRREKANHKRMHAKEVG